MGFRGFFRGREMLMSGDVDVAGGPGRLVQRRKPRANGFTRDKQEIFCAALAESCNVLASARRAGVSCQTVYKKRRSDLAFRVRWEEALAYGFAALEAGLLERAREAVGEFEPRASEKALVAAMDAKLAFALLQNHERNRGKAPGDVNQQRGDVDKVIERLEKALKRYAPDAAEQPAGESGA